MSTEPTDLVTSNNDGEITGYRVPSFQYTMVGILILYRLINNRDCKIIITSKGSTTGTGKTTLAVHLCRWVTAVANELFDREKDWNAEDHSFVDLYDYLSAYKNSDPGDALLMDEIEASADRRRFASHENVNLSQAWAILRYRNVVSVATLPTVTMLDSRMMELADIWINVQKPGVAYPYYLTANDFTGDVMRRRFRRGGMKEAIEWTPLDSDDDFQDLSSEKAEMGVPGVDDGDDITESDLNETKRSLKRDVVVELLELKEEESVDLTQHEIGQIVDLDQSTVSKIKREAL